MKKFHILLQSKGGVGKSFLTYLLALKYKTQSDILFCDADSSTKTSTTQLKFVPVAQLSLLDEVRKIDRSKIFENLENLANLKEFNYFVLDFGAPESEQFPAILAQDFSVRDFKAFAAFIDAEIVFHIVMGGGTAHKACGEYLIELNTLINPHQEENFDVQVWVNESTYTGFESQLVNLKTVLLDYPSISRINYFGDTPKNSLQTIIVSTIEKGQTLEQMSNFMARLKLKQEVEKVTLSITADC